MPTSRFPITASGSQAATYLLCVCLFSISFLVFLNSSVSFVITERIGEKKHVGDAVGTLGFADELVALVACPVWGALSDKIGVRTVAVTGYAIIGVSLLIFVQATNVYPQLLLGRMFFAIGGAACSTMVTAILPTMTDTAVTSNLESADHPNGNGTTRSFSPSISSELTITPARNRMAEDSSPTRDAGAIGSQLAGFVGLFTGLGALLAVGFFLPLPVRFEAGGATPGQAISDSFYVVGSVALVVAVVCFFGLRKLPGEGYKSIGNIFHSDGLPKHPEDGPESRSTTGHSYAKLFLNSVLLGFRDADIGLAYLGGFVARASSVAISLFIPLFVNAYFISSGRCPENPDDGFQDPSVIKRECRRAYIVASMLTGVSQLIALLCAPVFGYLSSRYKRTNLPLLLAAAAGICGYVPFGLLQTPDPGSENGSIGVFFIVALLGISQIGAIVCSLGILAKGIENEEEEPPPASESLVPHDNLPAHQPSDTTDETPLLSSTERQKSSSLSRLQLKGSIAGVYSLAGGAAILLLTKIGGLLFDQVDHGFPFFIMAGFNAMLLVVGTICAILRRGTVELS